MLYGLDISQIRSLDEFNDLLASYIRKAHTTEHSTTGETPLSVISAADILSGSLSHRNGWMNAS